MEFFHGTTLQTFPQSLREELPGFAITEDVLIEASVFRVTKLSSQTAILNFAAELARRPYLSHNSHTTLKDDTRMVTAF